MLGQMLFSRTSSSSDTPYPCDLTVHGTISSHDRHITSDKQHPFRSHSPGTSRHGKRPAWHDSHIQVLAFLLFDLIFPTSPFEFCKRICFPEHAEWLPFSDRKASLENEYQNQNEPDSFSLYVSDVLLH